MSAPAYDIVLIVHVATALVGFGAIAVAGLRARAGRRSADPADDSSLRRFFAMGPDWPARTIFLVPLLGLLLLFGGDRSEVSAVWPWLGLGLWTGAVGAATGVCWPAERQAQEALRRLAKVAGAAVGSGVVAEADAGDAAADAHVADADVADADAADADAGDADAADADVADADAADPDAADPDAADAHAGDAAAGALGAADAGIALSEDFRLSCRRMERSVGLISLCFLAAVVVMVLQPR